MLGIAWLSHLMLIFFIVGAVSLFPFPSFDAWFCPYSTLALLSPPAAAAVAGGAALFVLEDAVEPLIP